MTDTETSTIIVHATYPSTTTDHRGAVDADIEVRGVACSVTLIPDPCGNGELGRWGDLDHWADGGLVTMIEEAEDGPELCDAIVYAVREAWESQVRESGSACGTDASCLTARETANGWSVRDEHGGVWWPSEEAAEQIEAATDPASLAVELCFTDPDCGEWCS